LVLSSFISIAQELSGYFSDHFARLQWPQAPVLAQQRTEDSKTHTPLFFLRDSSRVRDVEGLRGINVRTQEATKTYKGKCTKAM